MTPEAHTNPRVIFFIVRALAVYALFGLIGTIALIWVKADGHDIAVLSALASGAVSYMSGLLSSTRTIQPPEKPVDAAPTPAPAPAPETK